MDKGIGDFLSDEPLPVEPEAEVVTQEPEVPVEAEPVTDERPRGPDGKFIKKDETGVEEPQPEAVAEPVPPTEPTNQLPKEEYSALRAVRDENKELKRRLDAIQHQMSAPQPQPQQQQVDFWDDPQQYLQGQFAQFGQQLFQQFEQRREAERIDQSEKAAKARYADYDPAFEAFSSAVQANPQLAVEMAQAADPAEFAYSKGKLALTLQNAGSLDAIIAAERAKWEAEVRAVVPQPRVTLPSTTAADGSVAGRGAPVFSGPTPMGDILR